GFDTERLDPSNELGAHTILEVLKLALADRDAWYSDDGSAPLATLLSPEYASLRRALVTDAASADSRPGSPDGRVPRIPDPGTSATSGDGLAGAGEPTVSRSGVTKGDTCHIDIAGAPRYLVSLSPSRRGRRWAA